MNRLIRVLRWMCLLAGICGMAISAWAFIDPGAFPAMRMDGTLAPPSPRWRAAFAFLFSLLMAGYGSGRLRHRVLP
jgi:hypothetical protein